MISMYMFQKVRDLNSQGISNRKIAEQLGIDRKTVADYLKLNAPPKYPPRVRESRADPFNQFDGLAASLLAAVPNLTAAEIFVAAKEHGYVGSERTVERRIAACKAQRPKERFFDQEYEPGEQAQFDFKESVRLPFTDGVRVVNLHFGTLPFSDFFWIKGYGIKTFEAFMDGIHSFFERAGGMTEKIRFDNLSPCVRKVLKGNERLYTAAFERATAYYGFGLLPCAPGKGSDKGDVEREIRTQAHRILNAVKITGKVFRDFDDLNAWLGDHCIKYQLAKTAPLFAEEQLKLKRLPPRDEDILCKIETTMASPYGTVRIAKTTYSVPDGAIGASCRVVAGPYHVKIYRIGGKGELVATHVRGSEGESSIPLEHVLPSLIRKPRAMVRWSHRAILFPTPVFTRFYERLKQLAADGAEREYLRAINLVQYTTLAEIGAGMELVLESGGCNLFEHLKDLILSGGHHPQAAAPPVAALSQIPLKPELSMYDCLIPQLLETGT
jgi:transposase